jgi:DNA-binding transcriptional ArsR family regulator
VISRDLKPLLTGLHRISSVSALKVLMVLAAHANRSGACWLSWATIARLSGLSRRAVADGLRRLEEVGLVKRIGPAPRGRGTMYRLCPVDAGGERPFTRCTTVHQGGERPCTRVVNGRAPIAKVHARAPSEGRNPRRTGILVQDPGQLGGEQPCTIEGEGNTEGVPKGVRPPASGPSAFNWASGPEASGLGEIQPEEDGFTLWFHFEDGVVSVTPITAERAEIGFWMDGMLESARVAGPALDPRTWQGLLQAVPPRFAAQAREVLPAVQAGLRRWMAASENRRCWTSWAEENRRERLAEQLVEQLLGSAPHSEELQGLLVGAEDLVRLRDHLQRTRPDLVEAFRKAALAAFGGSERFSAAWKDAHRSGVGYCHSRAWGRIAIVPGQVRGLTDAVLQAWAGILGAAPPGPSSQPQQALQAAGPLHEVAR